MELRILGTGSTGNCYLLDADGETLILDAGLRFRDVQQGLGYDLSQVTGCLITHEHKDHSKAVSNLAAAGVNVYMSEGTANAIGATGHRIRTVRAREQIKVGGFAILPFDVQHDAAEPLGFLITYGAEKLLYLTDSYYCKYRFKGVHYYLVECNYCDDIVERRMDDGHIPYPLGVRLKESHMSLDRLKDFLHASVTPDARNIVLIHLSDGNSDESRMVREVQAQTGAETVAARNGMQIELNRYPF